MKKLDPATCSDQELVQRIEELWGDQVTYVAPLPSKEEGVRLFSCLDLGDEAHLWVHTLDGYVVVKAKKTLYGDVLGTIN